MAVSCYPEGLVTVRGEPAAAGGGGAAHAMAVQLPAQLDASSAVALFTPAGQLYVRVNSAH